MHAMKKRVLPASATGVLTRWRHSWSTYMADTAEQRRADKWRTAPRPGHGSLVQSVAPAAGRTIVKGGNARGLPLALAHGDEHFRAL